MKNSTSWLFEAYSGLHVIYVLLLWSFNKVCRDYCISIATKCSMEATVWERTRIYEIYKGQTPKLLRILIPWKRLRTNVYFDNISLITALSAFLTRPQRNDFRFEDFLQEHLIIPLFARQFQACCFDISDLSWSYFQRFIRMLFTL